MSDVLRSEDNGVITLCLNRPEVKNAVHGGVMTALEHEISAISRRTDVRAVILTASGNESFCSGGDLQWLQRYETGAAGEEMSRRMHGILGQLSRLPCPVIGVINGYALGGGAELALACDMRIMEEQAFLCFKQVQMGLITGWGGAGRLLNLVGYAQAFEILTTCPKIMPDGAQALGLTNMVTEKGQGMTTAHKLLERMARGAPGAIRAVKTLLSAETKHRIAESDELEAQLFRQVWASADHKEAISAFFEKRHPSFSGKS